MHIGNQLRVLMGGCGAMPMPTACIVLSKRYNPDVMVMRATYPSTDRSPTAVKSPPRALLLAMTQVACRCVHAHALWVHRKHAKHMQYATKYTHEERIH